PHATRRLRASRFRARRTQPARARRRARDSRAAVSGTSGAFTANNVARTIIETGSLSGPLTVGGPGAPSTLVSIFCMPLTFSSLVDTAEDIPGPGAIAIPGIAQALP